MGPRADRHIGDLWRQMDLHVHTPISAETRYGDRERDSTWNKFFDALRELGPRISILGINDYWSVDGYSRVKEQFERGNLPDVDLVVPVVEMRLTDSISNKQKQNYHVCFDPSISTDVIKQYFLSKLESSFKFPSGPRGPFALGDPGFISLGQQLVETGVVEAQNSAPTQTELLDIGKKQFAVDLTAVRQLLDQEWFKAKTMEFVGYSETKDVPNSGHEGLAKKFLLTADGAFLASLDSTSFYNNREKLRKIKSDIPLIHASDAHRFDDGVEETRHLGKSEMWVRCSPNFESLQFAVKKFNDRLSYGEPEDSKRKNGIAGNLSLIHI